MDDDDDEVGCKGDDDEERGEGDLHAPHWPLALLLGQPGLPHWLPGKVQFLCEQLGAEHNQ